MGPVAVCAAIGPGLKSGSGRRIRTDISEVVGPGVLPLDDPRAIELPTKGHSCFRLLLGVRNGPSGYRPSRR